MFKYALIAVFVLAFTDPALASYWIVRGSDKKCIVVDMEPTDKNNQHEVVTVAALTDMFSGEIDVC